MPQAEARFVSPSSTRRWRSWTTKDWKRNIQRQIVLWLAKILIFVRSIPYRSKLIISGQADLLLHSPLTWNRRAGAVFNSPKMCRLYWIKKKKSSDFDTCIDQRSIDREYWLSWTGPNLTSVQVDIFIRCTQLPGHKLYSLGQRNDWLTGLQTNGRNESQKIGTQLYSGRNQLTAIFCVFTNT